MPRRAIRIGRSATGLGMFAVKPIKRAAHIAAYRGPLLTDEESERLEARNNRYLFTLNSKWTIDGSRRYNLARYINHSCRPNAKPITRKGGIVIISIRRIEPGEEITYDYGADYKYFFFSKGRCRCQHCRDKAERKRRRRREELRLAKAKRRGRTSARRANGARKNAKRARRKSA
ncbi:MAG TPA: SET domain-containing protein [Xanthobacteraceae bacterium]|nr:SET domain-containing protein [Xanthobacteraceae bacterium]